MDESIRVERATVYRDRPLWPSVAAFLALAFSALALTFRGPGRLFAVAAPALVVLAAIGAFAVAAVLTRRTLRPSGKALVAVDGIRFDGILVVRKEEIGLVWQDEKAVVVVARSNRTALLELSSKEDAASVVARMSCARTEDRYWSTFAARPWARIAGFFAPAMILCVHLVWHVTAINLWIFGACLVFLMIAACYGRARIGVERIVLAWPLKRTSIAYQDILSVSSGFAGLVLSLRRGDKFHLVPSRGTDKFIASFIRARIR